MHRLLAAGEDEGAGPVSEQDCGAAIRPVGDSAQDLCADEKDTPPIEDVGSKPTISTRFEYDSRPPERAVSLPHIGLLIARCPNRLACVSA